MTFAEKSRGGKGLGHLENVIEDCKIYEDELTLREDPRRTHF